MNSNLSQAHRSQLDLRYSSSQTAWFAAVLGLVFIAAQNRAALPERLAASPGTALDRYVAAADTNFQWHLANTIKQPGATVYIVDLTSQSWLTSQEISRTLWKHWLTVIVPDNAAAGTGLMVIGGGSNEKPAPTKADGTLLAIAQATRTVVALIAQVPNQPLRVPDRPQPLSEDALIAYTWDKFLRTGDERWPARLPMTKAVVRAMDVVTALCAKEVGGLKVDKFFVTGASKRGWTTWTTAAVDQRVTGIAPVVIDVLNIEESLKAHYRSYGFFARAVGNYTNEHIPEWIGTPESRKLMQIEDPWEYRARYTMPKLVVTATGDQFFPVDSAQFYFDGLPGPKYIRSVPNADHGLKNSDVWFGVLAFYQALLNGESLPRLSWKHTGPGVVEATAEPEPLEVRLWTATNPTARDFRLETTGPIWKSEPVKADAPGRYKARVAAPDKGWTAYMLEFKFKSGSLAPHTFTTDARIIPDTRPHSWPPPGYRLPK